MRGGDHSYPGVQLSAWNVTKDQLLRRQFPANFEICGKSNPTRWTTVIICLLSYHVHCVPISHKCSKVLLKPITYDAHHSQYTLSSQYFSIWSV